MALLGKMKPHLDGGVSTPGPGEPRNHGGVIGSVLSERFRRMDAMDRQNLIGEILAVHLDQKELRRIQVIVGVTPEEDVGRMDMNGG